MSIENIINQNSSLAVVFGGSQTPRQPPRPRPRPRPAASALGAPCVMPDGTGGRCGRVQGCASLLKHLRSRDVDYLKQLVCGELRRQTLLVRIFGNRFFFLVQLDLSAVACESV